MTLLVLIALAFFAYVLSPLWTSIDNIRAATLVDSHCGTKSRLTNAYILGNPADKGASHDAFKNLVIKDAADHFEKMDIKKALPYHRFQHRKGMALGLGALAFACVIANSHLHVQPSTKKQPTQVAIETKTSKAKIQLDDESKETIDSLLEELSATLFDKSTESGKSKEFEALEKLIKDFEAGNIESTRFWREFNRFAARLNENEIKTSEQSLSALHAYSKELKKNQATKALAKAVADKQWESTKKALETLEKQIAEDKTNKKQIAKVLNKAAEQLSKSLSNKEAVFSNKATKLKQAFKKAKQRLHDQNPPDKNKKMAQIRKTYEEKRQANKTASEEQKKNATHMELKKLATQTKKLATQLTQKGTTERTETKTSMKQMNKSFKKLSGDSRRISKAPRARSQLSDLREALRRAKRKTKGGAQSKLGRNKNKKNFDARASGKSPSDSKGTTQNDSSLTKAGNGMSSGGTEHGEGHKPDFTAAATKKIGTTKDSSLQGVQTKGRSIRETIVTSAQEGFSRRDYKDVYVKYKGITEEAIAKEEVPSGYRFMVKRYFKNIEPRTP